jgi:hypothetical protein
VYEEGGRGKWCCSDVHVAPAMEPDRRELFQALPIELADASPKMFRWLEDRNASRRNLDALARARVPGHAALPLPHLERPEATDLDIVAVRERTLDRVQETVDDQSAVLFRNPRTYGLCDLFDEVGLGHAISSEIR